MISMVGSWAGASQVVRRAESIVALRAAGLIWAFEVDWSWRREPARNPARPWINRSVVLAVSWVEPVSHCSLAAGSRKPKCGPTSNSGQFVLVATLGPMLAATME